MAGEKFSRLMLQASTGCLRQKAIYQVTLRVLLKGGLHGKMRKQNAQPSALVGVCQAKVNSMIFITLKVRLAVFPTAATGVLRRTAQATRGSRTSTMAARATTSRAAVVVFGLCGLFNYLSIQQLRGYRGRSPQWKNILYGCASIRASHYSATGVSRGTCRLATWRC